MNWFNKIIKISSSLKFAVVLLIYLGIVSAVGTIIEAKFDARVAQKLVYHSPWNVVGLIILAFILIAVMVDRWPWKRRHTGFILAHIGIIILLIGSWVTQKYGIDGSMPFEIGKSQKYITLPETEFLVYAALADGQFSLMNDKSREVDFIAHRPTEETPHIVQLGSKKIEVVEYQHFTNRESKIEKSDNPIDGGALRIQFESSRMNMSQWILRHRSQKEARVKLGPATVVLSRGDYKPSGEENEVIFYEKNDESISYEIYSKKLGKVSKKGVAKVGDLVPTGWMDIQIRFIQVYPNARETYKFVAQDSPGPMTSPAIRFRFDGEEHWMGQNATLRIWDEDKAYVISYGQKRLQIDFDLKLVHFEVGRYQGTMQAASYASDVVVNGKDKHHISMNNPLKHDGFTFYQASFEEDEMGKPRVSILSVNRDPGRPIKYLGSLLIVLGSLILFYFKKMQFKKRQSQEV